MDESSIGTVEAPVSALANEWLLKPEQASYGTVRFLVDGYEYVKRFRSNMARASNDSGLVIHSAWRITNVRIPPLETGAEKTLFQLFKETNASVYIRLSGHSFALSNLLTLTRLRFRSFRESRVSVFMDQSFASWFGSYHQKSTAFLFREGAVAMLGSIDLNSRRLDDNSHIRTLRNRRPSHDVGLELEGEIGYRLVQDEVDGWLRATYYRERVLWPFRTSKRSIPSRKVAQSATRELTQRPAGQGESLIQLLRTVPTPTRERHWTFYDATDTSFGEAYLHAVSKAKKYIYIEDQYFTPNFNDLGLPQWTHHRMENLLDALKGAIDRGALLVVVVPSRSPNGPGIRQLRDRAIDGLRRYAALGGRRTPLVCQLRSRDAKGQWRQVHVHSKVLICDDEFALVGSGNVNVRSFLNDTELSAAIVGPAAATLRKTLLAEHLQGDPAAAEHWEAAFSVVEAAISAAEPQRLQEYITRSPKTPPGRYRRSIWHLSEPSRSG